MNGSIRQVRVLVVGLLIATAGLTPALVSAGPAQASAYSFILNQGMTGGPGVSGGHGNYDQTFLAVEIRGLLKSGTIYGLDANDRDIPLAWEYYPGNTVKGSGSFYMTGTYDSSSGAVAGTFTYENSATGTIKGSLGDKALTFSMTWKGDVTGTIDGTVAALSFSGAYSSVCTLGGDDCATQGTQRQAVWFTVAGSAPTTVPEDADGENVVTVSGAVGDVYLSPASEADLETSQRTWRLIKPGDRIALTDGVMLRTGRDGSLKIQFADSSRIRLQPSTLFGVQKVVQPTTSQMEMYTRLYEGIAYYYMENWAERHKKFEVDVHRVVVGIKGTTWSMSVTDTATVVTVSEGVVTLTDKATGEVTDVNAGEQATVDSAGTRKTAAPDASAPEDPAGSPAAGSSAPDPAGLTWGSGGGDTTPILIVVVGLVVALGAIAMASRRKPI